MHVTLAKFLVLNFPSECDFMSPAWEIDGKIEIKIVQ